MWGSPLLSRAFPNANSTLSHTQSSPPFLPGPPTFSCQLPQSPRLPSLSLDPLPFLKQSRPLPSAHSPNSPESSARPPSGQRLKGPTCFSPALPRPGWRNHFLFRFLASCAYQSENSKRDHPNDFRFLPGTELAGSEVRSGATSLARAGAGGLCDGLGAPRAGGEGWVGAGPRPEGRHVAAFPLRSLEEAVAVLFTQMPSLSLSPTHRLRDSGADKTRVLVISWDFHCAKPKLTDIAGVFVSHQLECNQ